MDNHYNYIACAYTVGVHSKPRHPHPAPDGFFLGLAVITHSRRINEADIYLQDVFIRGNTVVIVIVVNSGGSIL